MAPTTTFFAQLLFLALMLGSSVVYADVSFSSNIVITDDTKMPNAYLPAKMYYFYNTTAGAFNHFVRTDYTVPVFMIEVINYTSATRYKYCGECFAETFTDVADDLFWRDGDARVPSLDYDDCECYTRTSGTMKKYWVKATDHYVLCKAILIDDAGDSRTLTFTNYSKTVPAGTFEIVHTWDCPGPVCKRVMDMVLILDESGSIDQEEWLSILNFATLLVNQFTIDIEHTNIGVVFFSTVARLIIPLSKNKDSIINALHTTKAGGWTCIGCGISVAVQNVMPYKVLGRTSNPAELTVTLTDGQNNRPIESSTYPGFVGTPESNLTASVQLLVSQGITSIAIGVGKDFSQDELELIASDVVGVETVIMVNDFASLPTVIDKLVQTTCTTLGTLPCGDQCFGFCSCNQTCVCPPCITINACFTNNCTVRADGSSDGCVIRPVDCDDKNACTLDTCDNATGCKHTSISCDDGDACTDDHCDPASGCYYTPTDCDLGDPCYEYGCDSDTGCFSNYLCDDNPCYIGTCTATGCAYQFACNDNDLCTRDWCNTTGGPHCQYDPIDVATECDDGQFCTIDVCYPSIGCSHVPRNCNPDSFCETWFCNETSDQCEMILNADCDGCYYALAEGLNCTSDNPCLIGYCVNFNETWGVCAYRNVTCPTTNPCLNAFCNVTTGKCEATETICADNGFCTIGVCNETDGSCYVKDVECPSDDPCFVGYCDVEDGLCKRRSFCEERPCQISTCTPSPDGLSATCTYEDIDCSTGSLCVIGYCDNETGNCMLNHVLCSDGLVCTDDSCVPSIGCVFTNRTCDDGDPCTLDFCSESVPGGCYHEPKCVDDLYCTEDVCLLDGSCVFREKDCSGELNFRGPGKECFVEACTEERHCYYKVSNSAFLDVCGNCILLYGMNESLWNESWIRTACVERMTWPEYVASLTAAALAGIIVAAIVVALILALSGFFGTKEIIRRAKLAANQAAVNNPLYQEPGNTGVNPAYTGD